MKVQLAPEPLTIIVTDLIDHGLISDFAMGWRNLRFGPWNRKAMSGAFTAVSRPFLRVPVHDPSCPCLPINRAGLEKILSGNVVILKQGFWWEFLARAVALDLRIVEARVRNRVHASGVTQAYRPAKAPRPALLRNFCSVRSPKRT